MAIAAAVALAVLLAVYVTRLRRKETRFGWVVMRLSAVSDTVGVSRDPNATIKPNWKIENCP